LIGESKKPSVTLLGNISKKVTLVGYDTCFVVRLCRSSFSRYRLTSHDTGFVTVTAL